MSNIQLIEKDIMAVAAIPPHLKKKRRVLVLTEDDVEDIEFFYPYYRLTEAGYDVDVATIDGGPFKGKHNTGLKNSLPITSLSPADYELLYLPGGKAPEKLAQDPEVIYFVQRFARTGRLIAAFCHGPQILVAARLLEGRRLAAWPEVRDEVEAAGATFVDEAVVEDNQLITGRMPGDLHRHLRTVVARLERQATEQQQRSRGLGFGGLLGANIL